MAPAIIVPAGRPGGPYQVVGAFAGGGGGSAMSFITDATTKHYFTTTWTHAPTDPTKATLSFWQKFINIPGGGTWYTFTTDAIGSRIFDYAYDGFASRLSVVDDFSSIYAIKCGDPVTSIISNDNTNWHHYCISIDTNQAVAADRVKMYHNGVLEVYGGLDTFPVQFSDPRITANTIASYIGEVSYQIGGSSGIPDAKFAYYHLIDGLALTPTSFISGTTGLGNIHPATYAGAYGNNGFLLNGNASTLLDQSGRGNDWTAPNGVAYSADLPT